MVVERTADHMHRSHIRSTFSPLDVGGEEKKTELVSPGIVDGMYFPCRRMMLTQDHAAPRLLPAKLSGALGLSISLRLDLDWGKCVCRLIFEKDPAEPSGFFCLCAARLLHTDEVLLKG